jgi:hypothetical protein
LARRNRSTTGALGLPVLLPSIGAGAYPDVRNFTDSSFLIAEVDNGMSSFKPKCISLFAFSAVIAQRVAYDGINKNGLN